MEGFDEAPIGIGTPRLRVNTDPFPGTLVSLHVAQVNLFFRSTLS
jgi:hypothetical protein